MLSRPDPEKNCVKILSGMAKRFPRKKKQKKISSFTEPWALYCRFPEALTPGNDIELLLDGKRAYPAMLEAISGAEQSILMDNYIFHDDKAGHLFSKALCERSQAGIEVYLIVDGVGTLHVPSAFFNEMEEAGVNVLVYRSPAPWRRSFGLLRRDHRKMLVVDSRVGFAGGLNIGDEWLPKEMGGQGWHDVHVRIEGPAVRELSKLALSTWRIQHGVELDQRLFLPEVPPVGTEYVSIIGSRERKKRQVMRQSYLQAIRRARNYIYIANAYFLPGIGFRRALRNACKRGVDVRVMVPKKGDILPFQLASQALFARTMKTGIRLFLWEDAMLHAKTAVIDDQWATVGSFNIDHRSWNMNLEVNVNAVGSTLPQQLKAVFLDDQKNCTELDLDRWKQRPWVQRLAERFFYQFRKWM